MGQLFRIYPLRKTLLLIKTKTGGRYSGVVCHRTTDRVPVPMMFVRGGQEGRDEFASICEATRGRHHSHHPRHSRAASVV